MAPPRTGPTLICVRCQKAFYVVPNRAKLAKYCSKECKYADRKPTTLLTKICLQCDKEFETWRAHDNDFCSRKCRHGSMVRKISRVCEVCGKTFWIKRTVKDVRCCSWKCRVDGIHMRRDQTRRSDPYFWQSIRRRILERDGWTCQSCKLVSFNGRLHVHHKIHRKDGGTEEDENLITMCEACHKAEHRRKEKEGKLSWQVQQF